MTLAFAYPLIDPYDETWDPHEITFQIPEQPLTNGNDTNFEDQLISGVNLYTILAEAQETLLKTRNLGHCGAIPSVQATYTATKINGWPLCTTAWQHYKKETEAKDFVRSARALWQESSSPTLLEHFFSQQHQQDDFRVRSNTSERESDIELVSNSDSDLNSDMVASDADLDKPKEDDRSISRAKALAWPQQLVTVRHPHTPKNTQDHPCMHWLRTL